MPMINQISISSLYGIYNHTISFKDEGVTIIHGPNGVGKTAILKCIKYIVSNDVESLSKIPFNNITISLVDGQEYTITKINNKTAKQNKPTQQAMFMLEVKNKGKVDKTSIYGISQELINLADAFANQSGNIVKISNTSWMNKKNLKILSAADIIDEYVPEMITKKFSRSKSIENIFPENIKVKLIDTNRLNLVEKEESEKRFFTSTIIDCSNDLISKIKRATTDYGRVSQALDQSFPYRLINGEYKNLTLDDAISRLEELEMQQAELSSLGLLAAKVEPSIPANVESLTESKLEAISLVILDTEQKLNELRTIADRCKILLNIFKKKFRNKTIKIHAEKGLHVTDINNSPLSLTSLSSGEQHEIVISYELLFKTAPETIVLIDEPEISLHVSWQKSFISDLLEISRAVGFESIIATHSPFIVGDHHELLCPLNMELQ